jgi:hypothetical protein
MIWPTSGGGFVVGESHGRIPSRESQLLTSIVVYPVFVTPACPEFRYGVLWLSYEHSMAPWEG